MNEDLIKKLALVFAIQAEIEGMKAENLYCKMNGHPPYYTYTHFFYKARDLRQIAYAKSEQNQNQ